MYTGHVICTQDMCYVHRLRYIRPMLRYTRLMWSYIRPMWSHIKPMLSYIRPKFSYITSMLSHMRPMLSYIRLMLSHIRLSTQTCWVHRALANQQNSSNLGHGKVQRLSEHQYMG